MSSDADVRFERAMDAATSIAAQDGADGIMAALLDAVMVACDLESARVRLVNPATGGLRTMARRGPAEAPEEVAIDGATPASLAFATRAAQRSSGGTAWTLPLESRGRVVGVLELERGSPLADVEVAVLVGIAKVASAALLRHVGGDAEALRTRWTALRSANLAISDALAILPATHMKVAVQRGFQLWPTTPDASIGESLEQVLKSIVVHARNVAAARYAAIGIGESPERPFEFWAVDGVSPELEARVGRRPRPLGTLGVVARQGQVVRVRDVRRHPAFAGFPPHHPEVTSFLGVPVQYGGQSVGNLYLGNKIGADEFSEDDQRSVEMLATNAALALQQTYLRAAIEAHHAQVHSILESAPHGILFVDAHTGHLIANPRSMELLGDLDPTQGQQAYARLLRRPDGSPVAVNELLSTRALRGESPPAEEFMIVRADGRRIPVLESAAPVLGFGNRVLGAVVNFQEISAFKKLERLREEFAAMIAHDLRNPVQTILVQTDLLSDDESLDPEFRRGVSRIADNARQLARMANDLLDSARVDLHAIQLERRPTCLADATKEVLGRLIPAIGQHRIRFDASGEGGQVALDPARFDQILSNLIDNAVKFSPPDTPIEVRVASAPGGSIVSVEDHGTGIPAEELGLLFDRFYQSRRARARGLGVGLGLSIAKGLVEAHGGRIWVESQLGRGSTFFVWLPAGAAAHSQPVAPVTR